MSDSADMLRACDMPRLFSVVDCFHVMQSDLAEDDDDDDDDDVDDQPTAGPSGMQKVSCFLRMYLTTVVLSRNTIVICLPAYVSKQVLTEVSVHR